MSARASVFRLKGVEAHMKRSLTGIVAATLFATVVDAQSSRYFVQDLGTLPGATFSQASDGAFLIS